MYLNVMPTTHVEGNKDKNNMPNKNKKAVNCEDCMYFEYDEEYEEYYCTQSCMDEDDQARMAEDSRFVCPFYRTGNEYTIVKKQI